MTVADRTTRRRWNLVSLAASSRTALWSAFVLVHLWLGYLNFYAAGYGLSDVTVVYRQWAEQAVFAHYWVGIDGAFVYPILAFAPMLASAFFGFALYGSTWLSMVMILNAIALAFLTGWGRPRAHLALGWWWTGFLLLLGPIALGRIDSITIPIGLVAVTLLARRPRVATVLLTVATWMKIWPVALLAALVVVRRDRSRFIETAVATSIAIVGIALAFGSGLNVFSFITEQTGRGLQVEAPVTTFWIWQAYAGVPGATVYYDLDILTYQVTGAGVGVAGALMTPLLVLAVALVCTLGFLAVRRGAESSRVLPLLALALVVSLIAFNKVGSPQFIMWLAVPVVLGMSLRAAGLSGSFRVPASIVLALALLTQVIYPYLYAQLISLNAGMLMVLTARNILTFVLLGWALRQLWLLALRPGTPVRDATGSDAAAATADDGALIRDVAAPDDFPSPSIR